MLLNFSYRDSHRLDTSDLFASTASATTGTGNEAWQKIGTAEGSWVINSRSHLTFRYTDYTNETQGRPDNIASVSASTDIGTRLDVNRLDQIGLLTVPAPVAGQAAFNDFVQPLIDRYGYVDNGVKVGGGTVGYGTTFDEDNFFREGRADRLQRRSSAAALRHDLHVGYQRYVDAEDLIRSSNGWGSITVPGGRLSFNGTPIFYTAALPAAGPRPGADDPLRVPVAELRGQRHHPLARLDVQRRHRSPATTRCTARACRRIRRSR